MPRETGARRSGDWLRRLRRCLSRSQNGDSRQEEGRQSPQYVDRLSGEPARRQVRRHRACEVERPLYDPGAKKEYRNEF